MAKGAWYRLCSWKRAWRQVRLNAIATGEVENVGLLRRKQKRHLRFDSAQRPDAERSRSADAGQKRFLEIQSRMNQQNDAVSAPENSENLPNFVDRKTRRHKLDVLYERFSKPQLKGFFEPDEPSIYIRHHEGQKVFGGYRVEKVFEDARSGFYAEGRVPLRGKNPPVLVIRGYGSWYPIDRVFEDTPDVFIAQLQRQFKSAEKEAVVWLREKCQNGDRPDVVGESLGGKVAQQIAARYPDCLRSVVTFNPLGVSQKVANLCQVKYVFHYFTLGERYAFWANRGCYVPGIVFQISTCGNNWKYKIAERIVRNTPFPIKRFKSKRKLCRFLEILLRILAQFILLIRHNKLILNHANAVVVEVDIQELYEK